MRIVTIAVGFIVLVAALVLTVSSVKSEVDTVRFEVKTQVFTRDDVQIEVRVFGSYEKDISVRNERNKLFDILREKFGAIDYNEIPKKVKLMFRDELNAAEERGIKVDSISYVKIEDSQK
jgi:effector-binding domain-containing protein